MKYKLSDHMISETNDEKFFTELNKFTKVT